MGNSEYYCYNTVGALRNLHATRAGSISIQREARQIKGGEGQNKEGHLKVKYLQNLRYIHKLISIIKQMGW